MACEIAVSGRVVLVLWGRPELSDLPRVDGAVRGARAEAGPVIFIARVPAHAEAPDPQVRVAITGMLESFMAQCSSYHTVLEGSGFAAAAKRMVLATIFLMTRRREKSHVHSNCDALLSVATAEERDELTVALRALRERGLLDRGEPATL